HLLLRPYEQGGVVEIPRSGGGSPRDALDARRDAPRRAQHAVQEVDHHRQDHDEEYYVPDPPEGQRGLLSATIDALRAIPGRAPRITSNCALIALTAGPSGRRCSDSTPWSAPSSAASPSEILARPRRISISASASTAMTTTASTTLKTISAVVLMSRRTRR